MTSHRLSKIALALLIGVGLLVVGSAAGTTPQGEQVRATVHGPPNNADTSAVDSAVAHNPTDNEYLLVWEGGVPGVLGKTEIYGRLLNADGTPKGDQFPISETPGDQNNDARTPDVIFDETNGKYFVVWQSSLGPTPRADILGRIVTRAGAPSDQPIDLTRLNLPALPVPPAVVASDPAIAWDSKTGLTLLVWSDNRPGQGGSEIHAELQNRTFSFPAVPPDAIRISDMGGDTNGYNALAPDVAYDPASGDFIVVWHGDDNTDPLVNNEQEIFAQRVQPAGGSKSFTEIGEDIRVSDAGPDGDLDYYARNAAVAHDAGSGSFLIAWQGLDGDTPVPAEAQEIYGRRADFSDPAGVTVLGDDTRYSDMGPDGDGNYSAQNPDVAANPAVSEFLIAWDGDDDTAPLANNEEEVFVQRVGPDGAEILGDTVVSDMGPVIGSTFYRAARPALAFNSTSNLYLAAWEGDDDSVGEGQVGLDDEFEIWTRQVAGGQTAPPPGTPPGGGVPGTTGPPSAPNCAPTPDLSGAGGSGTLTLTATQLKINQRIGQAAVRRANAIQGWLADGIVGGDLCGGALAPEALDAGVVTSQGVLGPIPSIAGPRPLVIPAAADKGDVTFSLSIRQLRTNQRVYAAAVRRANALKARIEGGLTGGDITDASLGRDRLRQDLSISSLTPAATPTAASSTDVATASTTPADFKLTVGQLRTNQRIAAAAVRRTNELRALLAAGLKDANFADGTISAVDLAP